MRPVINVNTGNIIQYTALIFPLLKFIKGLIMACN